MEDGQDLSRFNVHMCMHECHVNVLHVHVNVVCHGSCGSCMCTAECGGHIGGRVVGWNGTVLLVNHGYGEGFFLVSERAKVSWSQLLKELIGPQTCAGGKTTPVFRFSPK